MVDTQHIIEGAALRLFIDNREPIGLETIAELLAVMGKDYKQWSGRELTIQSAHRGSLTVLLMDYGKAALEIIGGVLTVKEFAELIKSQLTKAKQEPNLLGKTRSPGVKTVKALIKASRKTSGDIEISYSNDSEQIYVKLTRSDAEQLHLADERRERESMRAVAQRPEILSLEEKVDKEIETWAKAAADTGGGAIFELNENPALALARALVIDVRERPGGRERLEAISRSLRAQQRQDAAQLLDQLVSS